MSKGEYAHTHRWVSGPGGGNETVVCEHCGIELDSKRHGIRLFVHGDDDFTVIECRCEWLTTGPYPLVVKAYLKHHPLKGRGK